MMPGVRHVQGLRSRQMIDHLIVGYPWDFLSGKGEFH
jgi:hypothetical protein